MTDQPVPMVQLYVRRIATREIVATIPLPDTVSARAVESTIRGLLVNLRDDCFVDSSEVYDAIGMREGEVDGA